MLKVKIFRKRLKDHKVIDNQMEVKIDHLTGDMI